jgi:type IV secretory pathway VirB10-like protein
VAEEPAAPEETVDEPVAEELAPVEVETEKPVTKAAPEPTRASEGTLKDKLTNVRAKADEAREARLRANAALYEGLSAAYDFALDAEDAPEEYLKLVEAQGLKIQLRNPMKPVVKLAFAETCDDLTIKQLEAVLAWAFDQEVERGTLLESIEAAGGVGAVLSGDKKAA